VTDKPDFDAAALEVIQALRPGEVASYGEVAAEAGYPGAARAVGNLLRRSTGLPWWRVVSSDGRLVPGSAGEQRRLLEAEGVPITGAGKVAGSALRKRSK
jgi:methylated-DNA-protein-cysteine methyltransferase-like protein